MVSYRISVFRISPFKKRNVKKVAEVVVYKSPLIRVRVFILHAQYIIFKKSKIYSNCTF